MPASSESLPYGLMVEQRQKGDSIFACSRVTGRGGEQVLKASLRCRLAQAFAAQAILAVERHRQPHVFVSAPARSRQRAGEFRSAPRTGDLSGGLRFQTMGHGLCRNFAADFRKRILLLRDSVNLGHLVRAEFPADRLDVLLDLLDAGGAGDHACDLRPRRQP